MSLSFDFGRLGRLARKELSESLRDRRTIVTLLLMPVLLYPLLTIGLQQVLLSSAADKGRPSYRIAFASEKEAAAFLEAVKRGQSSLIARSNPTKEDADKAVGPPHLTPFPDLKYGTVEDVAGAVQQGAFEVGVRLRSPQAKAPVGPGLLDYEAVYREGSLAGRDAVRYLEQLLGESNTRRLADQFAALRRAPHWPGPIAVRVEGLPDPSGKKRQPAVYRVGFVSQGEADFILGYYREGRKGLIERNRRPPGRMGQGPTAPHQVPLPTLEGIILADVPAIGEAVKQGKVDMGVHLRASARQPGTTNCFLLYREGSLPGLECVRHFEHFIGEANAVMLGRHVQVLRYPQALAVRARVTTVARLEPARSALLPVLVPLVLVLMTMTGAVYPAIDLTAGERERGTLEILVAAPIPRLSVLFAKYLAVVTVALLTALVNLGTMAVTLHVSGIGQALFGSELSPLVLVQVLGLLVLFAAFFSAVLLVVTSFARSFKEAQAYLIPLVLVSIMPGMIALMPGIELRGPLAVVPLLNIVLMARDIFEGTASFAVGLVVIVTTLLYALAAIGLAARIFGTEAVLSEQSGWGDVFRRPERPQEHATASSALLCLALMFPAFFLLLSGLARLDLEPAERLLLMAAANLLLFGAFPLVSAWLGRVRLRTALLTQAPPLLAWPAAVLLGLCLWPFVHELGLLMRLAGVGTLRPEHLERIKEVLAQWRELSPVLVVGSLAVVPAVLEELFFRGYLFSALRSWADRPWPVVLATAALFALFHVLVGGSLAVERLPPSFLLGIVLGWVCWRTGSVWPGVVLHALHNGSVVLLGQYEPHLPEWLTAGEEHLPVGVLLAAGVGAGLGAVGMWRHVFNVPISSSPRQSAR